MDGKIICIGLNIKHIPRAYRDFWNYFISSIEDSLAETLRLKDFHIEKKIGRFLPYTMSDGFQPPLIGLSLYLRLPFVWPLLGMQFLVVGERR